MNPISEKDFSKFIEEAGFARAPKSIGIGCQLNSVSHQQRTVVVQFLEDESSDYLAQILRLLFSIENEWVVFPRYGDIEGLIEIPASRDSVAARFGAGELDQIITSMVSIQQNGKVIEYDPYFLAGSGEILGTWDHHVFSDGFGVQFASVSKSTSFISLLNEFGAEFNVYYSNA